MKRYIRSSKNSYRKYHDEVLSMMMHQASLHDVQDYLDGLEITDNLSSEDYADLMDFANVLADQYDSTNRTITIEIEFATSVSASETLPSNYTNIEYRPSMRPEDQYSEQQLIWYDDFITNILNSIRDSGFDIVKKYQSTESYSYYVQFEAFTADGKSLGHFNIKLCVTDHSKNKENGSASAQGEISSRKRVIFRRILINGVSVSGLASAMKKIWLIEDGLREGNIDILDNFEEENS